MNRVMQLGRLVRDPETKQVNGTTVLQGTIATSRKWKASDGEIKEKPCYVDFKIWGKRADAFARFVFKGHIVYMEGQLDLDSWETDDGSKRSKLSILVENFEFLPQKKGDDERQSAPRAQPQEPEYASGGSNYDYGDDDIPF